MDLNIPGIKLLDKVFFSIGAGVGIEEKISLYCVSIQGNTGYCDKSLNDLLLKIFNHNNNSNVEIFQSFQLSIKFERKSKLLELLFIL